MNRETVLQQAFDEVVAIIGDLEGSDWLAIHTEIAREIGVDKEMFFEDYWKKHYPQEYYLKTLPRCVCVEYSLYKLRCDNDDCKDNYYVEGLSDGTNPLLIIERGKKEGWEITEYYCLCPDCKHGGE